MSLPRTLEPEVMDSAEEASDYDSMDHAEVNGRFCADLLAVAPDVRRVLDMGTGTALIPIELCRRAPDVTLDAIDLATHMLHLARRNVARAGLSARIALGRRDAKATGWPSRTFDAVVSNSIVHHVAAPRAILEEMWRLVRPGGRLFVRDLTRPPSEERVAELVGRYAPSPDGLPAERAVFERQRDLFAASLRAALTTDEVRELVATLGIRADDVRATGDRHWTLSSVKP